MRRKLRSGWGILGVAVSIILTFSIAWAQSQTPGTQSSAAQAQTGPSRAPVIRTMTRLVQLSVVVSDKKGLPVTGLKPEDFTVLDGGQAEKIEIFKAPEPLRSATQPIRTLPPNIFTNRHDKLGEAPGSKSIIFLDALSTLPQDQEFAREQVLKFLKSIQPQDHFAIYALMNAGQVVIVHEFTQDDTALVKAIKEFQIKQPAGNILPFAAPMDFPGLPEPVFPMPPVDAMSPGDSMDPQAIVDQRAADYARMRVYPLASALIHIANHVSAIPGRKNLIWISGGIKAMGAVSSQQNAPLFGTSVMAESQHLPDKLKLSDLGYRLSEPKYVDTQRELFRAVIEACNASNLALYTVDVHGLTVRGTGIDPSQRGGMNLGVTSQSLQGQLNSLGFEQDVRFVYRQFADGTGGTAFYGNNDLNEGMSKAFDDGRYAYTIGYYPNHGTWNGDFRKLEIKVARPDVHARHRDGYYATEDIDGLQTDPERQIQEMGNSPLDSSALSMMVSVRHTKAQPASTLGAEHELEFQVGVDVAQLLLERAGGRRIGSIDLVFIQRDQKGEALAAEKKHVELDFTEAQYQGLLTAGAIFERHLDLKEAAKDVRVLVRDGGSGQIGTVTVPLKNFMGK